MPAPPTSAVASHGTIPSSRATPQSTVDLLWSLPPHNLATCLKSVGLRRCSSSRRPGVVSPARHTDPRSTMASPSTLQQQHSTNDEDELDQSTTTHNIRVDHGEQIQKIQTENSRNLLCIPPFTLSLTKEHCDGQQQLKGTAPGFVLNPGFASFRHWEGGDLC